MSSMPIEMHDSPASDSSDQQITSLVIRSSRRSETIRCRRIIMALAAAAWALGLVATAGGLTSLAEAQVPAWKERSYNPQPAAEDLVLPMPCGGAMAFRPVLTQGTGWLDDVRFQVGYADPAVGYKEDLRFEHIAGAFSADGSTERRIYYMGKYEVTELQYDAVQAWAQHKTEDACPKDSPGLRLPEAGLSWFEAVLFGRDYSEWLLANAGDALPQETDVPGFIRLPTEAEWEYAARGGLAVDYASHAANLFPMEGEPAEYVWHQGSQSAGGKLHPIGLLKPNPLGLHDILGNASELVLEPFRLNHRGRLHGQAGGFVTKGGDVLTSISQLRTALRDEHHYFDVRTRQAKRPELVGMRVVLTVPVIVSEQRLSSIQDEWAKLPAPDLEQPSSRTETRAIAALDQVAQSVPDDNVRLQLEQVRAQLDHARAERNEAHDRWLSALLRVGAFLGNKTRMDLARFRAISRAIDDVAKPELEKLRKELEGRAEGSSILDRAKRQLEEMEADRARVLSALERSFSYYTDTVVSVANDNTLEMVATQLKPVKVAFESRQSPELSGFAETFVEHVGHYKRHGTVDQQRWLNDLSN